MNINYKLLRRPAAALSALALVVGSAAPALLGSSSVYADQLTSRSVQMSDSAPSGTAYTGVGSGDNVSYTISFTTSAASQSFVIDFCGGSPLIEDTCTAVSGLDASTATAGTLPANWSLGAGGDAPTTSRLKFTASASEAAGSLSFEVDSITNPDTTGTFFARITTYADAAYGAGDPYVSAANVGTYVDYGGAAMSINEIITVTARVMEQISLCADGGDAANATNLAAQDSCGAATTPAITLGSAPDYVLGYTGATPASANVYTQLSTNASGGYALYLRASNNACASNSGGLSRDGGATCEIAPINTGSATADTFTDNTAEFGAFVSDGTAATGGFGQNTAVARWDGTGSTYLMDTTTASDNVLSTYGSKIAETVSGNGDPYQADSVNNTITFAAVASPTTPAGIYSENFTLIGVGTF